MAMLKRMALQGVRSFSPDDNKGQWIEFGSPLTLILGINGSGKTTIIEALKYAITSQFPPNSSKGASFVNDPKLTYGDCAVAKVMLELYDSKGNRIITTRKVKTTIKSAKGDLTTSQLEGTLRITNTKGVTKELTNKCQDIKMEICRIMGVSEAILNHVIFCHQEESCWPLDEGKKVKETFDAIFNTLAYKKCFDRLANMDKDFNTKIKVEQEGLRYAKENRALAVRYRSELEDKQTQFQSHSNSIKEYERDLNIMEKKLEEFNRMEMDYAKKYDEIVKKKANLESLKKQVEELRGQIKEEHRGSIADLKETIVNFEREGVAKRNRIKEHEREYRVLEGKRKDLDASKSRLLKEEGMFQQEENANKKRVAELQALMAEAVSALNSLKESVPEDVLTASFSSFLDSCNSQSGEYSFDPVSKTLSTAIRMKDNELQKVKANFDREERELQKVIDDARSKQASMLKEIDMKKKELVNARQSFEELKERLKSLEGSNEKLKLLDNDEESLAEQIETIEKSGFMTKCDSEIKALAEELKQLDSKMGNVSATVSLLHADKSKTDQIGLLNREKLQKENQCGEIMRKMEDDLKRILGQVPEDGIGAAIERKLKELNAELKEKKAELKRVEGASTSTKVDIRHVTTDLKKMETKLKNCKEKVADVLEDSDYQTRYEELSSELDKAQQDSYFAESASFLYKKYIAKLTKKDCCPLCKRDFQAKEMTKKLVEEIQGDITRLQDNLPKLKENVERLKEQHQQVLDIKPVWDEIQTLTEEISSKRLRKAELDQRAETLMDETDGLAMTVSGIECEMEMASKCRPNAALYEQCKKEVKKFDEKIAKLESSRDPEAKDSTMNLNDAEIQLEEIRQALKTKRSEKERKEETRNKKRDELAKLQDRKNKVKEEKLKITAELQNREALEEQKKDLEKSAKDLQAKITELTQQLPGVKTEITEAETNKEACSERREASMHKLREEKASFEKRKTNILEKNKHIQEFERKRGQFAEIDRKIEECRNSLESCDSKMKELGKAVEGLKKDITNQELKERELKDNLMLKEKLEQMTSLSKELQEKEKLMNQVQNRGVTKEKRELQDKHQTTLAKLSGIKGQLLELKQAIRRLESDLNDPTFKNAERDYTERVAKLVTYQKGQRDLRRYKTVLDTAIMQFHKKRMEKINQILHQYWRRIYKGNDIDRIMIKTEADKEPAAPAKGNKVKVTTGTGRKSYNYRVVMVRKAGVEIDMRGRCSAGQRVLASIIIRIALAESFGARCGIISLDEPTTNLDQKNINSLAEALAELAEKMSNRKSFQLLVITHDQEFTDKLTAVDAVDAFWKVDRDREGFSRITKVPKAIVPERKK